MVDESRTRIWGPWWRLTHHKGWWRGKAEELGDSSHAVFGGLKRIENVKKIEKWVSHDLYVRTIDRNCHVSRSVLCFCATSIRATIHFWIGSSHVMKSGSSTTRETFRAVVGHRWATQTLPKGENLPKKTMVTVWWSAAGVIHYNFLQPGKLSQ